MNTYDWFKICNMTEMRALEIDSREFTLILGQYGIKTVTVFWNESDSVLVDEVFLVASMNGKNPFEFEERAVFVDENDDLWVGYLI